MTESDTDNTDRPTSDRPISGRASAFLPAVRPADRRTLLRRAGLAALIGGGAVGLAACGGNSSSAPAGSTEPSQAPSSSGAGSSTPSSSASSAASSASSSSGGSSAAKPTGYEVPAADVPEGGGVISGDYVVTQPSAGSYKAFSKICTHQGCPVNRVADGQIHCPCHGSVFSITDGSPQGGPANKPLAAATVKKSGSDLFITS